MLNLDPTLVRTLAESPVLTIVEFFTITFIIMATYFAMYRSFSHMQASTKMMVSMLLGTVTYTFAKIFVVTVFLDPLIQNSYVKPF